MQPPSIFAYPFFLGRIFVLPKLQPSYTLLDLRGSVPTFIHISDCKMHDVNVLDLLLPEAGAFYVMDRGYVDFGRLFTEHQGSAFFVIRAKSNLQYRRLYSHPVDKGLGLRCD